jgi:hypothetical protein
MKLDADDVDGNNGCLNHLKLCQFVMVIEAARNELATLLM